MLRRVLTLSRVGSLLASLGMGFGAQLQPVQAAENPPEPPPENHDNLQTYQRRYISLYQQEGNELDAFLVRFLQRELPRFDYPLLASPAELSLGDFLNQARQYQQDHAGELAAGQTPEDLHFGDKVVTWSDTRRLLDSAYVFAPHWSFSPLKIEGPAQAANDQGWYLVLKSHLSLDLPLYKLAADGPQEQTRFNEDWEIVKLLRIDALDAIRARMQRELGQAPQPEDKAAFLQALRQLSPFGALLDSLEQQNPRQYMQGVARKALAAELSPPEKMAELSQQALKLGTVGELSLFNPEMIGQAGQLLEGVTSLYKLQSLLAEIRKMPEFQLKGQVLEALPKSDRVRLGLGGDETVDSLGLHLDAGYRIVEYRSDREKPVDIGFVKVRDLQEQEVQAQTIMATRSFEPGDQYLEYPKTPFEVKFRGGIGSLILLGQQGVPQDTAPEFSTEISYDLAPLLGWSETYLSLNGAYGSVDWLGNASQQPGQQPIQQPVQQPTQGQQQGATVSATVLTGELGLSKRFYFHQWILALGARLGIMNGILSQPQDTLTQQTFGGTLFGGAYYQVNPDFIVGVDLGWREYMNGGPSWNGTVGPVTLSYGLASSGPVLGFFVNYHL